jgi:transcriptional repressor NrdR
MIFFALYLATGKSAHTMHCPYCGNKESEVVETRESSDMDTIRRRRSCLVCTKRYTTYERVENIALIVIKRDKRREQFNREKLKNGIWKACDKTVIPAEVLEKMVTEITRELRGQDSLEVESRLIGEMVAKRLKRLDKVAYIRFASVFKRFVDVEDFEKEVQKLTQISARQ